MKKCPICNKRITITMILHRKSFQSTTDLFKEHFEDGKGGIRCPHCNSRLRKKKSVWFLLALIPFLISCIVYAFTHQYEVFLILSVIFFIIVYISLPYVPYKD